MGETASRSYCDLKEGRSTVLPNRGRFFGAMDKAIAKQKHVTANRFLEIFDALPLEIQEIAA